MKRCKVLRFCAGAFGLSAIIFLAGDCAGQILALGEWGGALESHSGFLRTDIKTGQSQRSNFQNLLTENSLRLDNNGAYIYDPRLISFSFGGTIGLSNNWYSGTGASSSRQGLLWGYNFSSTILPEKPFSLNLFANRNQSSFSGGIAGETDLLTENFGFTFFANRLYIPSTIHFLRETWDSKSHSAGVVTRQNQERTFLTYEGRRGWINSEMSLGYEFVDVADKFFPASSYHSHRGNLYYGLDFGSELNWHSASRADFFTRSGLTDLQSFNFNQDVRIDHAENFKTDYGYRFYRVETSGGAATTQFGRFHLFHKLYMNLTTNAGIDATFQNVPDGQQNYYVGNLGFAYYKKLPSGAGLNLGLGGALGYQTSDFQGSQSFVPQETHVVASPFALPVSLNNAFVVSQTVVVTKISFGPLPIGCVAPSGPPTLLLLGRDFTLQTVGDLTEIVPIPCSGSNPGINPGDTIAVDYRFSVSPSRTILTTSWNASVSLDYQWIRWYFLHNQSNQTLLSGQDGIFLDDLRSERLGVILRYTRQRLWGDVSGEFENYASQRQSYNAVRSNQSLSYAIRPNAQLGFNANESFTSFSRPSRQVLNLTARANLNYRWDANLYSDAFLALGFLNDTSSLHEFNTLGGVTLRWTYGKVDVMPKLEFWNVWRGDTNTLNIRATLGIVRHF